MAGSILPGEASDSLFSQPASFGAQDSVSSCFSSGDAATDALTKAAESGDLEEVKRLLEGGSTGPHSTAGDQIELGGPQSPTATDINGMVIVL